MAELELSSQYDAETIKKYTDYLEDLRQSGETNMFGAATYLQWEFGLEKAEARRVLNYWMQEKSAGRL